MRARLIIIAAIVLSLLPAVQLPSQAQSAGFYQPKAAAPLTRVPAKQQQATKTANEQEQPAAKKDNRSLTRKIADRLWKWHNWY
jgi:hypothetical protein